MYSLIKISYFLYFGLFFLSSFIACDEYLQQLSYSQPQQQNGTNTFIVDNISNNERDSTYPQTESSGNNVYMVWQDNMFGQNRLNYDILLKSSTDGGQTFGDIVNLSNNTGFSEHPQIAVNGSNVHIVWADNTSLNRDIYIISSTDGGQTFGDIVNLSNNTADSYNQEISVSGNNVYVVWQDAPKYTQGNSNISFIASTDGGQTFDDMINISNNADKTSFPKISSYQDNVYVSWNVDRKDQVGTISDKPAEGIYFAKSNDKGKNFDQEILLNSGEQPGEVQIAANDSSVFIVWGSPDPSTNNYQNNTPSNAKSSNRNMIGDGIYFIKSIDNGNSFTKPSFIKDKFLSPLNVELIQYSDELFIAIQATPINNTIEGNQDIFLKRSQDMGSSFSNAMNISNNPGISECPSMTVTPDNDLLLVWQDKTTGNNEAFSTKINLQNKYP